MTKDQALQVAAQGKKVKHEDWPAGKYIYAKDGRYIVHEEGKEDTFYTIKDPEKNGRRIPHPDRLKTWKVYEDEMPESSSSTSSQPVAKLVNNKSEAKPQNLVRL